ncbi:hypothetical protein PHPALM_30133 [Phytophthora palmivora]|uniref:Uncharacterized protein n=1 Tax=Phytophthora palmivora TaxID=4796 RepID=A0A2P4X5V9_9STRA|nr:hypothetical protein PHPALM_30133 [Phytophthora palmivora]
MFAPREVGGDKWAQLEKELVRPVNSISIGALAEGTKRLLEAMGCECTMTPTKPALEVWDLRDVSTEVTKWKRKLKDMFGVRGLPSTNLKEADPRKIPLPETPKKAKAVSQFATPPTKKEVFSTSAASPYFVDSHMVSPKKRSPVVSPKNTRRGRRVNEADDDEDEADYNDIGDPLSDLATQIRRTYLLDNEEDAQRVTVTNHISLRKLTKFSGTRHRSERLLKWLKKFVYEMEGTNTSQSRWCEAFQLCVEEGASHWVRQLPKKTRKRWPPLCEAFMTYYCSQHDQTPEDRYYTPERDVGERICDYLLRLNGYARSAYISYEFGGPIGRRHVKRFLDTCNEDELVAQLIPQRFDNIANVEAVINDKLVADRRRQVVKGAVAAITTGARIAAVSGKIVAKIETIAGVTAKAGVMTGMDVRSR